ncbi:hypothetical protein [Streptomyces chryseus]|uniref:hypothetical protein n=1 Tax=Streptomyces chryseus TaxID=68186 RepID=UPI00110FCB0C|nr:hypothetical protein [Streptomyces chryseus]
MHFTQRPLRQPMSTSPSAPVSPAGDTAARTPAAPVARFHAPADWAMSISRYACARLIPSSPCAYSPRPR